MSDSTIKALTNTTSLTGTPGALDLLLLAKLVSGTDAANPNNNTYAPENMFVRDFLASLGLSQNNKIINGDMRIDQRNAGASLTPASDGTYTVDRWAARMSQASKFSVQQFNTTANNTFAALGMPGGITVTSLAATTVGSTDFFALEQPIEAGNLQDLVFGRASAQSVTISFAVQASVTGTYSGLLYNNSAGFSYPFSFALTANTPKIVSVTIPGDTSNAINTGINAGLTLRISFGAGASKAASAGSWQSGNFFGVTSQTNLVATNGATMALGGVKLERGSVPTPFVPDDFATAMQRCQRYYQVIGIGNVGEYAGQGQATGISAAICNFPLRVSMRTAATTITLPPAGGSVGDGCFLDGTVSVPGTVGTNTGINESVATFRVSGSGYSGLTAGQSSIFYLNNATITISAEL